MIALSYLSLATVHMYVHYDLCTDNTDIIEGERKEVIYIDASHKKIRFKICTYIYLTFFYLLSIFSRVVSKSPNFIFLSFRKAI